MYKKIPHELFQNSLHTKAKNVSSEQIRVDFYDPLVKPEDDNLFFIYGMTNYTISFPHLTNTMSSSCLTRGPYAIIILLCVLLVILMRNTLRIISNFNKKYSAYYWQFLRKILCVLLISKIIENQIIEG